AAAGTAAVVAQVGWHPNPELVLPDPSRLGNGWKRLFSSQGATLLVKAAVKITIVLAVAYNVLRALGAGALGATLLPPEAALALAGSGLRQLLVAMVVALALLAGADYAWARWRHEQSLRMSRHEVREEVKQSEGDPHVRMRFRRAHREIARRRMLSEV